MKYHVNPATGVPGVCTASRNSCPFGDADAHAASPAAAVKKLEQRFQDESRGVIRSQGQKLVPSFGRYRHGDGLAIDYTSTTEGPYGSLTVNIPGVALAPDEVIVNANLYDREMLRKAEQAFFTYTGVKVQSGFVSYPVAKLSPAFYELALKSETR